MPLRVLLSCANEGFCYLDLTRTTKFKYDEKESEKDSGRSSTMYNVAIVQRNGYYPPYIIYYYQSVNITVFLLFFPCS